MAVTDDQPAGYLFQLRQNISLDGDLHLARIELEALLPGRVAALEKIDRAPSRFPALRAAGDLAAHARPQGTQAFCAQGPLERLLVLIRRLSFVQRIYGVIPYSEDMLAWLAAVEQQVGPVISWQRVGDELVIQALPHNALLELSDVVVRKAADPADVPQDLEWLLAALMGRSEERRAMTLARTALAARSTTAHLSHDLHYYKAKFFPRLARSMLNVCAERMNGRDMRVVDNFVGSGTTLVEASSLGMPAVGLDIDPLSVLIARAKMATLTLDSDLLAAGVERSLALLDAGEPPPPAAFAFPEWMLKNRKLTPELAGQLGGEIARAQTAVANCDPRLDLLFRVLLSDAIARRIRMRFLGTGVGRFSLTLSRYTVPQLLVRSLARTVKVTAAIAWLRQTLHLEFAPTRVLQGDARQVPSGVGRFDVLLTSPPYLPASSGRESYARARAPSLIALNLHTEQSVGRLADHSIGSMPASDQDRRAAESAVDLDRLLPRERAAVEWLQADELRAIKATPTAHYFGDLRRTFQAMRRLLTPGGAAVMVSGKQSTFYQFSTRKPLYVVESAELLAEEARRAGFEVTDLIDVQLAKLNRNARPRSLDDYYETLIMLRNPG